MSGKRAKRLRRDQRAAGIEPLLDAKRRQSAEEAARREQQQAEAERFRRDHPEEYALRQREARQASERALRTMAAVMAAIIR
jgi:hypothetical protein